MIMMVDYFDFIMVIIMIMSCHAFCFVVKFFIGFSEGLDFYFDRFGSNSDNTTFIIFFYLRTF